MGTTLTYKILTVVTFLTATTVLPITGTILVYFLMIGIDTILGRMDFQTRVQGKFELTKEQVLEVVNDETKLFGFVAPHVVEFLSPLNPELAVEGLEEVEQGRRPN